MTKLSLLFLSLLACNNGKITAGDSDDADLETGDNLPTGPEEDVGGEDAPQAQPEEDADLSDDEPPEDGETDTGTVTPGSEDVDGAEDDTEVTLEDYLGTYCGTYAVPCMGYPSVDECVEAMLVAHFTGCSVTDRDALAECDAWVATIDCAETSWNPACDEFITCD